MCLTLIYRLQLIYCYCLHGMSFFSSYIFNLLVFFKCVSCRDHIPGFCILPNMTISVFSRAFCCCSVPKLYSVLYNPMNCSIARLPCPSISHGACSNSRPSSPWCHPTISSSVIPFSCCFQSFLALDSFPMSQLFTSGGQKYWSFSISSSNEYSGLISFRIDWYDFLTVQGTLKSLLQHSSKVSILWL